MQRKRKRVNTRELSRLPSSPHRDAPPARSGPTASAGRLHPGTQHARLAHRPPRDLRGTSHKGKRLLTLGVTSPEGKTKQTKTWRPRGRGAARRESSPEPAGSLGRDCGGEEGGSESRRRAGPGGRRAAGATVSGTGRACGASEAWSGAGKGPRAYIYAPMCLTPGGSGSGAPIGSQVTFYPLLLLLPLLLFTSVTMLNPTVLSRKPATCFLL